MGQWYTNSVPCCEERIVEQLEKEKHKKPYINGWCSAFMGAIEIVRKGGA